MDDILNLFGPQPDPMGKQVKQSDDISSLFGHQPDPFGNDPSQSIQAKSQGYSGDPDVPMGDSNQGIVHHTFEEYAAKPIASAAASAAKLVSGLSMLVAAPADYLSGTEFFPGSDQTFDPSSIHQQAMDIAGQAYDIAAAFHEEQRPDKSVSSVGRFVRGIEDIVPKAMAGAPAFILDAAVEGGLDSIRSGHDETTAKLQMAKDATMAGIFSSLPMASGTLLQSVAKGIGINVPLSVADQYVEKFLLKSRGYGQEAEQIDPLSAENLGTAVGMGAVFGGHQFIGAKKAAPDLAARLNDAIDKGQATHDEAIDVVKKSGLPSAFQKKMVEDLQQKKILDAGNIDDAIKAVNEGVDIKVGNDFTPEDVARNLKDASDRLAFLESNPTPETADELNFLRMNSENHDELVDKYGLTPAPKTPWMQNNEVPLDISGGDLGIKQAPIDSEQPFTMRKPEDVYSQFSPELAEKINTPLLLPDTPWIHKPGSVMDESLKALGWINNPNTEVSQLEGKRSDESWPDYLRRRQFNPGWIYTEPAEVKNDLHPLDAALAEMSNELKNGQVSRAWQNPEAGETTPASSSYPEWFKQSTIEAYNKNHPDNKISLSKESALSIINKVRNGEGLTDNQQNQWDYLKAVAENKQGGSPETATDAELKAVVDSGIDIHAPEDIPAGSLKEGDKVFVEGKNGIPDLVTHMGTEDGQIVLKDGEEIRVDPWDMVASMGVKPAETKPVNEILNGINPSIEYNGPSKDLHYFTAHDGPAKGGTFATRGLSPEEIKASYDNLQERFAKSDNTGKTLYSVAKEKEAAYPRLVNVHNLSEENLIHAEKMGGLAVPSLAITSPDKGGYERFGEITLVADKSLIDPDRPSSRVFNADAYSPRYPTVSYKVDRKKLYKMWDSLSGSFDATGKRISSQMDESEVARHGIKAIKDASAVKYEFLKENGIDIKPVYKKKDPLPKYLTKFGEGDFSEKDEAFREAAKKYYEDRIQTKDPEAREHVRKAFFDDNGDVHFSSLDKLAMNVRRYSRPNEIDNYETDKRIDKAMSKKGLADKFNQWAEEKFGDVISGEQVRNGNDRNGNAKYLPHDLDTVVSLMKKGLKDGEGFNYGVGSIRAVNSKEFKSIRDIQKSRDKIISEDDMDKIKEEVDKDFFAIADDLKQNYRFDAGRFGYYDEASAALKALAKGNLREFREYYKDVPKDKMENAAEFLVKLRNLPTQYFEAKLQRAVGLNEFKYAVMPKGTGKEAIDVAKKNSLVVKFYDRSNPGDRERVIGSLKDILFAKGQESPNTHTPESFTDTATSALNKVKGGLGQLMRHINVITDADIPDAVRKGAGVTAEEGSKITAFVHDGQAYIVADNIPKDWSNEQVVGLIKHEIADHILNLGKSDKEYQDIEQSMARMRDMKQKDVVAAYDKVPDSTKPEDVDREAIAYLIQDAPKNSIAQRFVSWFRDKLRSLSQVIPGFDRLRVAQWANNISVNDIVEMAHKALIRAPEMMGNNSINNDTKYSIVDGKGFKKEEPDNKLKPLDSRIDSAINRLGQFTDKSRYMKEDIKPAAAEAVTGFKLAALGIKSLVYPSSISDASKEASRIIIAKMGERNRGADQAKADLDKAYLKNEEYSGKLAKIIDLTRTSTGLLADSVFNRMDVKGQHDFITRMENGEKQPTQQLQDIADVVRNMFDRKVEQVRKLGTGALDRVIENYFPHIWKEKINDHQVQTILSKRPLEGSKAFTKHRVFEDIKSGIDAGYELISNNPLDLVFLKLHEMDKYIIAHSSLQEMAKTGVVRLVKMGEESPQGFKTIDGPFGVITKKNGDSYRYVATDDVSQVFRNYLSQTLYNNKAIGKIFTAYMGAANRLNMFQLGVGSMFHVGFVSNEAMISSGALGLKALSAGKFLKAGKYFLSAPIAPIKYGMTGDALLKSWAGDGQFMPTVIRMAELAGAKNGMDTRFNVDATAKMNQAWANGKVLKAIYHSPVALVEQMARPVMEGVVPRIKFGAFAEMCNSWLESHPNATNVELRDEAQRIWNRVDSRLGQVNYERLFMHNWSKNALQGLVRAPGWTGGTILEVGGGISDTGKAVFSLLKGEKPVLNDRMAYTASLLIYSAIANGLLTMAFTGEKPKDKDFLAFRTGRIDENGNPERWVLPTYMKDLFSYSQHPIDTLRNKTHPILSLFNDLAKNKDYYGVEVRHKDDNPIAQLAQVSGYVAKQFLPFWIRGAQKSRERGDNPVATVAPLLGVMPATGELTKTKAQNEMGQIIKERMATDKTRTQAQFDKSVMKKDLIKQFRTNNPLAEINLSDAVYSGQMTDKDAKNIRSDAKLSPAEVQFKSLTLQQAISVYEDATPKEKEEFLPLLIKKGNNIMAIPLSERDEIQRRFNKSVGR